MRWSRTRSFFPVTRELVYLDHAGSGPISTRVDEAQRRWCDLASRRGAFDTDPYGEEIERVRGRVAVLLGAEPEEIALTRNTTEGLGLVATGLDWRPRDVVVTCDGAHPSLVYPWQTLRSRGVTTELLRAPGGRLDIDVVERALASPRVRVLALSSVDWRSGTRHDLPALGALCRERGVLFCVDAIQSLGCLDLDVERCGIDFLASGGHKWLLAGAGCGIFYCARGLQERLQPAVVGWHNVREPGAVERYQTELCATAPRFEPGSLDTAAAFRLGAAVDLLLELGIEPIAQRVRALTDRLVEGLRKRGAEIRSPRGWGASGIVSFARPGEAAAETVARLRARRIHVVARGGAVRASPHFYNDESEIDALIESAG